MESKVPGEGTVTYDIRFRAYDPNGKGREAWFPEYLLSPSLSVARKEEILARDYGIEMEQEMGEELRQMCNLSEAIEEKGIEKGINLTKKVLRYVREGRNNDEIAELCGITIEQVHEITED